MQLQIRKRIGELVPFDKEKIKIAIIKAFNDIHPDEPAPEYAQEIANNIEQVAYECEEPLGVEDIQE